MASDRKKLDPQQLAAAVTRLGARWSVAGEDLKLVLAVKPMASAAQVVVAAAAIADDMDHHPTIVVEYQGVTLTIHTHDQKAITSLDVAYAERLEHWLCGAGYC